jgi:hypothetical protein
MTPHHAEYPRGVACLYEVHGVDEVGQRDAIQTYHTNA